MSESPHAWSCRHDSRPEMNPDGCQEQMIISFMATAVMSECGAPATDRDAGQRLCHEHFARRHPLAATECEERCRAAAFAPVLDTIRAAVLGEEPT